MFCKKCGNQLNENALFCPTCGEKCSTELSSKELGTIVNEKTSIIEKILRFINIVAMIFTGFIGFINLFTSNALGGLLMLAAIVILNIFVFNKKQIAKIKEKLSNTTLKKFIIPIIYIILPIILFTFVGIGASIGDSSSSSNPDNAAISYAQSELKSKLKNPDSLQVHSAEVYLKFEYGDYYYYNIRIDYSAQNGFGGYNRDTDYSVLVKVDKSNNRAYSVTTSEYLDAITQYNNSK